VSYRAAAVGAEVRIEPEGLIADLHVDTPVLGKLHWTPREDLSSTVALTMDFI
jgi:hypothetical protein